MEQLYLQQTTVLQITGGSILGKLDDVLQLVGCLLLRMLILNDLYKGQ